MRSIRSLAKPGVALLAAGGMVLLSAAPGVAARPLAEGSGVGLVLTIAGNPTDTGKYTSIDNGDGEQTSGSNTPVLKVLGNQPFINAGTLSQNAKSSSSNGNGKTAACAGIAGDGASLVGVDEGNCLKPGQNLTLNAASLDLSNVDVLPTDLTAGLGIPGLPLPDLNALLRQILTPIGGLGSQLLDATGLGLGLDLGAIQSRCVANAATGSVQGDTDITDAELFADLGPAGRVSILQLPVNPPPNTKVLTNLDVVVEAVRKALEQELSTLLNGAADPLNLLTNTVINALNDNLIKVLAPQLKPLEDNLLDITLNKQVRGNKSIEVTALDAHVLPAAQQFAGFNLADVQVGKSTCAVDSRNAPPPPNNPPNNPPNEPPNNPNNPEVPTSVPSGLAGASTDDGGISGLAAAASLAGLLALSTVAGVGVYRRRLTS